MRDLHDSTLGRPSVSETVCDGIQNIGNGRSMKLNGDSLLERSRVDVLDSNPDVLLLTKQQQSVDHVAVVDFKNRNVM